MPQNRHGGDRSNASPVSDEALVEQTRAGCLDTFEKLYQRHAPVAWRTALAITGNVHDAADAVAEAFARVLRAVPAGQLDDAARFRPYLLTATRNSALDILRRGARVRPTDDMVTLDRPMTTNGPSEHLEASADASMVAAAFAALPERWRTVLWLTEVEGVAPGDAASVLHTSPNAVAQLGVRARAGLRQQFLQAHLRSDAAQGCRSTVKVLGPYATGSLSAKAMARVDGHLADCPACVARLDELNELCSSLRRVAVPGVPATLGAWVAARSRAAGHLAVGASRHGALATLPAITAKPLVGAALGIIGVGIIGASVMGQSFAPLPQPAHPSVDLGGAPPSHVRHIGRLGSPTALPPSASTGAADSPTGPAPAPATTLASVAPGPGTTPGSAGSVAIGTPAAVVRSASPGAAATGQAGTSPGPPASVATDPSQPPAAPAASSTPTPLVQVSANLAVSALPVSASVGLGPGSCTGAQVGSIQVGCSQPASAQPSVKLSGSLVSLPSTLGLVH